MDNFDKDETEKFLRQFVSAVENGENIPERVLEYIALGVRNYLKGGVPWPEKQGRKPMQKDERIGRAAQIELAIELVEKEFDKKLTNKFLAKNLGCSAKKISRIRGDAKKFSQEPGQIPNYPELLNDYIVAKAWFMGEFMDEVNGRNMCIKLLEDLIDNYSKK